MRSITRILVVIVLSAFPVTHATEFEHLLGEHTYTVRKVSDCFEISNAAIPECVRHFHDESEKKLDAAFEKIRGSVVRDRKLLEETQAKWLAFRESECELRSASAQAYADPDRQKWLFVRACATDLNAQRLLQLEAISLGCDACLQ